jgi:hypothetical protein
MRVAVVLTGELRNIDFCYHWWHNLVERCDHEVTFYSSTWSHLNNACINDENKQQLENIAISRNSVSAALNLEYPSIHYHICNDSKLTELSIPVNLTRYFNAQSNHGLPYYFGRAYHMSQAVNIWFGELITHDIIIHTRWDSAVRNTNFFNDICKHAQDSIVFRGLKVDKGLLYACDWLYAGPADKMITLYQKDLDHYVDIYEYYYEKDPTVAQTFLIGHNIHSTYIMHQLETINNINFDCTLVRSHNLPFAFNEDTWQQLNKQFLNTTTPPVDI